MPTPAAGTDNGRAEAMSPPAWFTQALALFEAWHLRVRRFSRRTHTLLAIACMAPAVVSFSLFALEHAPPDGGVWRAVANVQTDLLGLLAWLLAYIGFSVLVGMRIVFGLGTRFYGQTSRRILGHESEYDTVQWVVFLWLPVFPLRSVRIRVSTGRASTMLGDYQFTEVADLPCNHRLAFQTFRTGWTRALAILVVSYLLLTGFASLADWLELGGNEALLELTRGGIFAALGLGVVGYYLIGVQDNRFPAPALIKRLPARLMRWRDGLFPRLKGSLRESAGTALTVFAFFLAGILALGTVGLMGAGLASVYSTAHAEWYQEEIAELKTLENQLDEEQAAIAVAVRELDEVEQVVADLDLQIGTAREDLQEALSKPEVAGTVKLTPARLDRVRRDITSLLRTREAWAVQRNDVRDQVDVLTGNYNELALRARQLARMIGVRLETKTSGRGI